MRLTLCATVVTVTILSSRPVLAGEPPRIREVKTDNTFFVPARPGDRYVITLNATRDGGISQLSGFIWSPHYIGGNGERMTGVRFKPTGNPDEFRCEFIVPDHQQEKPDVPLPKGHYRLEITSGHDAKGEYYAHDYLEIHSFPFDPEPGPPFEVRLKGSRIVYGADPPQIVFHVATRGEDRAAEYQVTVLDYFGRSIGEVLSGSLDLKQHESSEHRLMLPRADDAEQYRVLLELSDSTSDYTVQTSRRLLIERTSGPRRELILEDAVWQHLPVNELADEPPPDDAPWVAGPRSCGGMWTRGGLFGDNQCCFRRSDKSHMMIRGETEKFYESKNMI